MPEIVNWLEEYERDLTYVPCPHCHGKGETIVKRYTCEGAVIIDEKCPVCGGGGKVINLLPETVERLR